jgi:hypothetical protein
VYDTFFGVQIVLEFSRQMECPSLFSSNRQARYGSKKQGLAATEIQALISHPLKFLSSATATARYLEEQKGAHFGRCAPPCTL